MLRRPRRYPISQGVRRLGLKPNVPSNSTGTSSSPGRVLAVVAERCGAWAEVRDHLRTILTHLPPDDPEAQRIRGRLETVERNAREGSNR